MRPAQHSGHRLQSHLYGPLAADENIKERDAMYGINEEIFYLNNRFDASSDIFFIHHVELSEFDE